MKNLTHKTMAAITAAAFTLTLILAPAPARAAYHDRSDELPGMNTNLTPVLVIGGVLVAASVIFAIHKHNSKSASKTQGASDKSDARVADSAAGPIASPEKSDVTPQPTDTTAVTPLVPEKDSRLQLYIGLTDDRSRFQREGQAMDFSDLTLRAGVTIGF